MRHFRIAIGISIIGFIITYLFMGGASALYTVILLSILEISLSFDNAVVNAKVLKTMEPIWQQRFITYGIPIAVLGMRFLFPVLIVAIAGGMEIIETFNMAFNEPQEYKNRLEEINSVIYAFGGSFLLMVFLAFLFDADREIKWIKTIEDNALIKKIASAENGETLIATALGLWLVYQLQSVDIALAYFAGVLLHSFISTLDKVLNSDGVRNGVIGLLYLEILDASFSFDGVIGAFALSSNLFVIMIGLGIGAVFVRSLTLYMVEKETLKEYRYLEHGAHYALFALAIIMFIKIFMHVNEIIIGTIGITFIAVAVINSLKPEQSNTQIM